ncbi:MAG: hypothetical protein AB7P14_06470 [Blastocatellales bacterium]
MALARGATRLLAATMQAAALGMAGLLTVPFALAIARSLHEGVQERLFIRVFQGSGSSLLLT